MFDTNARDWALSTLELIPLSTQEIGRLAKLVPKFYEAKYEEEIQKLERILQTYQSPATACVEALT